MSVKRGRVDIALLGQHGFQRTDAKLRFPKVRNDRDRGRANGRDRAPRGLRANPPLRHTIAMPEASRTTSERWYSPAASTVSMRQSAGTVAWLASRWCWCSSPGGAALYFRYRLDLADRDHHLWPCHAVHASRGLDARRRRPCPRRYVLCGCFRAHESAGRSLWRVASAAAVHAGAVWFAVPYVARSWAILETSRETAGCRWCSCSRR